MAWPYIILVSEQGWFTSWSFLSSLSSLILFVFVSIQKSPPKIAIPNFLHFVCSCEILLVWIHEFVVLWVDLALSHLLTFPPLIRPKNFPNPTSTRSIFSLKSTSQSPSHRTSDSYWTSDIHWPTGRPTTTGLPVNPDETAFPQKKRPGLVVGRRTSNKRRDHPSPAPHRRQGPRAAPRHCSASSRLRFRPVRPGEHRPAISRPWSPFITMRSTLFSPDPPDSARICFFPVLRFSCFQDFGRFAEKTPRLHAFNN